MKIKNEGIKKFLGKMKFFKKIPFALAERPFLGCLILFIFSLALGGILFYKYVILAQKAKFEVFQKSSLFSEEIYQSVLGTWQKQEKEFNEADSKEYLNPFKTAAVTPSPIPSSPTPVVETPSPSPTSTPGVD